MSHQAAFIRVDNNGSGVAVADVSGFKGKYTGGQVSGSKYQISCTNIGAGDVSVVTIDVTPSGVDAGDYESIVDGTITLGSPQTLIIDGSFDSIRATAATSSDTYTLVVSLI